MSALVLPLRTELLEVTQMTDVEIDADSTAVLITDPQVDFLKPESVV